MEQGKPLVVLVAGPYRSGTNNEPERIERNLIRLKAAALAVYQAGHIPLIGEWVALPLAKQAGSEALGDAISEQFLYPVAARLLQRCDAVFRIEGASKGADGDVAIARERGLPVYFNAEELFAAYPVTYSSLHPCRCQRAKRTSWATGSRGPRMDTAGSSPCAMATSSQAQMRGQFWQSL